MERVLTLADDLARLEAELAPSFWRPVRAASLLAATRASEVE